VSLLQQVWTDVVGTQDPPSAEWVIVTGVLALALVAIAPAWRITRHVATIAHEGGHAVAALLSGRRLAGIRLHSDSSGVTVSRGRPRGPGMVFTALSGYIAPSLLGLLAAILLYQRHALAVLWVSLLLLTLMLLQIRNFRGLYSMLVAGFAVFAVSWWAPAQVQSVTAYLVTWFLLLAGPVTVWELQRARRRSREGASDADQLARLTHVPALVWVGFFLLVDVGALLLGGYLIWSPVPLP